MTNQDWMKDERLKDIDSIKINFLQKLVFEIQSLSDREKLPFLMALASSTRKNNISLTNEETETIMEVIKDHAPREDLTKINNILSLMKKK